MENVRERERERERESRTAEAKTKNPRVFFRLLSSSLSFLLSLSLSLSLYACVAFQGRCCQLKLVYSGRTRERTSEREGEAVSVKQLCVCVQTGAVQSPAGSSER